MATDTVKITTATDDPMAAHIVMESGRAEAAKQLGVDPSMVAIRGSVTSSSPDPDRTDVMIYDFVTTWGVIPTPST